MKHASLMTLTLAAAACGQAEPGRMPRSLEPVEVVVSPAQRASARESFPATITSERTADIATRMSGTVALVPVEVGARVRAGDVLVVLDDADVAARVSAASAAFALTELSHGRIARLAADGAASQQELDQSTAALEGARAANQEAEAQRAYAIVRAPFDGVVIRRMVNGGDLANPGAPLITLVAPGALKVVADLPALRMGSLTAGDVVWVSVPEESGVLEAHVTRTVPALGSGSRTFHVEATLDEVPTSWVPGSYARLSMEREGDGPRWVPEDALIERGQLRGVFTVVSDTLRLRWVRIGERRNGAVELLAGPAGALTVVRRPPPGLFDGLPVASARPEAWSPVGSTAPESFQ